MIVLLHTMACTHRTHRYELRGNELKSVEQEREKVLGFIIHQNVKTAAHAMHNSCKLGESNVRMIRRKMEKEVLVKL